MLCRKQKKEDTLKTVFKVFLGLLLLYLFGRFVILPSISPQASYYKTLYYGVWAVGQVFCLSLFITAIRMPGSSLRGVLMLVINPVVFGGFGYLQLSYWGLAGELAVYAVLFLLTGSLTMLAKKKPKEEARVNVSRVAGSPVIDTTIQAPQTTVGGRLVSPNGKGGITFDVGEAVDVTRASLVLRERELALKEVELKLKETELSQISRRDSMAALETLARLRQQDLGSISEEDFEAAVTGILAAFTPSKKPSDESIEEESGFQIGARLIS
jgi:hypothetical protein